MVAAQARDPRLGPRMTRSRPIAEAIEDAGDVLIGLSARQLPHDIDNRAIGDVAMLSFPIAGDDEPGVFAPLPVDDQDELRRRAVDRGHDDLFDKEPHDPFLQPHVGRGPNPHTREVLSELEELCAVGQCGRRRGRVQGTQPFFEGLDSGERRVPAPLPRFRDQPMLWLDDIVLAPGPLGLVPRLPELQVDGPALRLHFVGCRGARGEGRFEIAGTEDPQDLALDRLVDAEAAEGQAPVSRVIEGGAPTAIPRDVPLGPRVRDMQAAATLPTPEQPPKQTVVPAAPRRAP